MTVATLIFAAVASLAALLTVRLAAASAASGERAARAGERAVEQARLESKNRHYQEMVFQVQQLHVFKGTGHNVRHEGWYIPRNRLQVLTVGIDEDIPQTQAVLLCTMPKAAPTEESITELEEVIEQIQKTLYTEASAEEWQKIDGGPAPASCFSRLRDCRDCFPSAITRSATG